MLQHICITILHGWLAGLAGAGGAMLQHAPPQPPVLRGYYYFTWTKWYGITVLHGRTDGRAMPHHIGITILHG